MPKKIEVKGDIISNDDQWIYDWLEWDATSPRLIASQLPQTQEPIEVHINSGGGSVFAGSEIYTTLKDYPGEVTVKVVGLAASAASFIACAGDRVLISPTAQIMIHNASMWQGGDYRDMDHASTMLKNTNESIAKAYQMKSGRPYEELLKLMDDETWMTAEQAVEWGLADEVMFQQNTPQIVASVGTALLPQEVVSKLRGMKNTLIPKMIENTNTEQVSAQLALLKLKGATINE